MEGSNESAIYLEEARRLVEKSQNEGIVLRVMGAVAVRLHCAQYAGLHRKLGRLQGSEFTDIDFMTTSESVRKLPSFMHKEGYEKERQGVGMFVQGFGRETYRGRTGVDVFVDKLVMCHTIDMRPRMELDSPTIPLADILLEKLQIVEINLKDIKDVIILLREHEVGHGDQETINSDYVASLLSQDWGFYYTCSTNIKRIAESHIPSLDALSIEDRKDVQAKIANLLQMIEIHPKSAKWRIRSKIGTSKKWYNDVVEPG
jgi:DNA-binding transcriptional MerR regulator